MGQPRDDEADARFGEMVRAADPQPPTSVPPPAHEFWAAGAARRRARHRRRLSLTAAAAVVVLVAVSVPVLDNLIDDAGPGPSEITTTGTDGDGSQASSSTTAAPGGSEAPAPDAGSDGSTPATGEAPASSMPSSASSSEPTSPDQPAGSSEGDSLPTTTTIVPADAQSRGQDERPGDDPGAKSEDIMDLATLRDAARTAFGSSYGGATGTGGAYAVHVKPGQSPLPATFQGYPVIAAAYSWAELETALAFVRSHHQELTAHGVPIVDSAIEEQRLLIRISVSPLDPGMEVTTRDILGEGPWYLRDTTGGA